MDSGFTFFPGLVVAFGTTAFFISFSFGGLTLAFFVSATLLTEVGFLETGFTTFLAIGFAGFFAAGFSAFFTGFLATGFLALGFAAFLTDGFFTFLAIIQMIRYTN
ncbi:MAG: hypothetical protein ACK5D5_12775 [Bacteroidota bacterium]